MPGLPGEVVADHLSQLVWHKKVQLYSSLSRRSGMRTTHELREQTLQTQRCVRDLGLVYF